MTDYTKIHFVTITKWTILWDSPITNLSHIKKERQGLDDFNQQRLLHHLKMSC